MALADTTGAIGAVTKLLSDHLVRRAQPAVTHVAIGRPEEAANSTNNPKFNLFLYEVHFDGNMRNVSLQDGQPPPLWLTLKYLITGFDDDGESDTADAQEILGLGLSALQEVNYLRLDSLVAADVQKALADNPEPLKVTFDESTAELLGRIMQGTDEKYRTSVGFQVRPVLIAPGQPASFSLLVGVDYTVSPSGLTGPDAVGLDVLPSLGPQPSSTAPDCIQIGDVFDVIGNDMHLSNLDAMLGDAPLPIIAQRPDRLTCRVDTSLGTGTVVSAGTLPLTIRQSLPNGRFRSGPLVIVTLQPTLTTAAPGPLVVTGGKVSGTVTLTGLLLGASEDDILVALYDSNGAIAGSFDTVAGTKNQQQLTLTIPAARAVLTGNYLVILRVNGAQAKSSPSITLA
jgi:Pvc16 N-terminal domain